MCRKFVFKKIIMSVIGLYSWQKKKKQHRWPFTRDQKQKKNNTVDPKQCPQKISARSGMVKWCLKIEFWYRRVEWFWTFVEINSLLPHRRKDSTGKLKIFRPFAQKLENSWKTLFITNVFQFILEVVESVVSKFYY